MPRELTNLEVNAFLARHPDIYQQKNLLDAGGPTSPAYPLAYPLSGLAVQEPSTRYVLVWRDAGRVWHFIDLSDMPDFASEANKPQYYAPDSSLVDAIMRRIQELLKTAEDLSGTLPIVVAVMGLIWVFGSLNRR